MDHAGKHNRNTEENKDNTESKTCTLINILKYTAVKKKQLLKINWITKGNALPLLI